MKKLLMLCALTVLVAGCGDMSKYTKADENATDQTKLRACMLAEAQSRYNAGTLFEGELKATAKTISNTCLTKLALQKAGISSEAQSTAEEIISGFKKVATTPAK